jgi:hypothetical protein
MRKLFKLFAFFLLVGFLVAGCGGDDENDVGYNSDSPGAISGLGDAPGDVVGEVFKFPDGVSIEGGVESPRFYPSSHVLSKNIDANIPYLSVIANVNGGYDVAAGSGGAYVLLTITLRNTNNVNTVVTFPAGLVALSADGRAQNGLLIKKTSVVVPANGKLKVALAMYCANLSRSSSAGHPYSSDFIIVRSSTLQELFDLVANKRINIEEYDDSSKSSYWSVVHNMTRIVWNVTDGNGLTDGDRAYMANLEASR